MNSNMILHTTGWWKLRMCCEAFLGVKMSKKRVKTPAENWFLNSFVIKSNEFARF